MTKTVPLQAFGIILAGGSGTRFSPLSRSQYPQQVLRLLGSESMLQATWPRGVSAAPFTCQIKKSDKFQGKLTTDDGIPYTT